MPDIARLDEDGLLVAVETVADDDHATDLAKGKIALPDGHDMRQHLKSYRWDVRRGYFIPLSMEPLAEAERATPELVEGLVEAIEDLYETVMKRDPPAVTKRALQKFRRAVPRRKPVTVELSSDKAAAQLEAAEASISNNPPALPADETNKGGEQR